MFSNFDYDPMGRSFRDQFSTDSNEFFYRKNQRGVPIYVTKAERDDFVTTFNKRVRYATLLIFPSTIIYILSLVWLVPDIKSPISSLGDWVGPVAVLVPFMAIYYWAWNAPARDLQYRTPAGAALTKEEARTLAFSKITYGRLALQAATGVGLVWIKFTTIDMFHGGGVVWLVLGGFLIALAGIKAIRKWLFIQQ